MSEIFFYSAGSKGFYAGSMQEAYMLADSWPEDVIEINETLYRNLLKGQAEGRIITHGASGQPKLSEPPEPSVEELIAQAEITRAELFKEANIRITPLQDADELGIASEDEKERLACWKRYRVSLNRLDLSTAPDIDWPERPA
ncbi:tail fiber assembly protein [Enterobacter kobei]|uniref:tail fiber assembly protein n=1 Tax=Enterobacter kobei TaxID=208224 RepID=UPI0004A12770|nr:tail fiber assembly protein [Enterobacter kobei]KDF47176.1 hypothetical protein AE42_00741 [Enterobacter kobei]